MEASLLKEKVILSDFIKKDINLVCKGKNFLGLCPFHSEKTPSFLINDEKGYYHCFGCNSHGDIFSYIMQTKNLPFIEAVQEVASFFGIKIDNHTKISNSNKKENIFDRIVIEYQKKLQNSMEAQSYLEKRGINKNTIDEFQIGLSDNTLSGFDNKDLKELGLVNDDGQLFFNSRIMFPIKNHFGQVVGFGGRVFKEPLSKKTTYPKYINSKENKDFQKKELLYGYDVAKKYASKNNPFIVVEGYFDVIALHQYGFKTAVATLGTAINETHLDLLFKRENTPIICFDGDLAGFNASMKFLDLIMPKLSSDKTASFISLETADPFDTITIKGSSFFKDLLKESLSCFDFFYNSTNIFNAKTPEEKAKCKINALNKIKSIKDKQVQMYYRESFFEKIKKNRPLKKIEKDMRADFLNEKKGNGEKILIATAQIYPELKDLMYPYLENVTFKNQNLEKVKDKILMGDSFDIIEFDDSLYKTAPFLKKNCKSEEVLKGWFEVFHAVFEKNEYKKEIENSTDQMKKHFNENSWKKLKYLKNLVKN